MNMPKRKPGKTKPKILLYNRKKKAIEKEIIFEKWFMDIFYGTAPGRFFMSIFLNKWPFSRLYGYYQRRPKSAQKINNFITKYHINIDEIEIPPEGFPNFNDFFVRKLKPSARPINRNPNILIAPADSRLLVYPIENGMIIPVKGVEFTLKELLCDTVIVKPFYTGLCLVFRLAPVDYHRFCYIDDGEHGPVVPLEGNFHSISPLALRHNLKILQKNYRQYCVLHTKNFGEVLHIDIGALTVGKIKQHLGYGGNFFRGQEKGYFELGGSTIILILKPYAVVIDEDIVEHSQQGIETLVKYGAAIGKKYEKIQNNSNYLHRR